MIDITEIRENLIDEALQAETEKKEREEAERLEAYRKREAEERAKRHARNAPVWMGIINHLTSYLGRKAELVDGHKLIVEGVDVTYHIWIEEMTEKLDHRGFRKRATGKLRVVVEEPDTKWSRRTNMSYEGYAKRSFPQKKDGTHNYKEICEIIVRLVNKTLAERMRNAAKQLNGPVVEELRKELGIDNYGRVRLFPNQNPQTAGEKPVKFKLELDIDMTTDEARAIYAKLVLMGLVK